MEQNLQHQSRLIKKSTFFEKVLSQSKFSWKIVLAKKFYQNKISVTGYYKGLAMQDYKHLCHRFKYTIVQKTVVKADREGFNHLFCRYSHMVE